MDKNKEDSLRDLLRQVNSSNVKGDIYSCIEDSIPILCQDEIVKFTYYIQTFFRSLIYLKLNGFYIGNSIELLLSQTINCLKED